MERVSYRATTKSGNSEKVREHQKKSGNLYSIKENHGGKKDFSKGQGQSGKPKFCVISLQSGDFFHTQL